MWVVQLMFLFLNHNYILFYYYYYYYFLFVANFVIHWNETAMGFLSTGPPGKSP